MTKTTDRALEVGHAPTQVDKATFDKLRKIVHDRSGIFLRDGKEAMVSARISKRMRILNIDCYKEYLDYLTKDTSGEESIHFLDVISTNVTHFFREGEHFDFMRKIFQKWVARGQRRFRFWCAACSSGEEPYSLAMTLLDVLDRPGLDIRILGTDISTRILKRCNEGIYPWESLKTVPPPFRKKYFKECDVEGGTKYQIKPVVKNLVTFKRLNLSSMPFPMRGPLDAVLCRNVMIYFDKELCTNLLSEIHRLLKDDGYLMTGHAESLTCMLGDFKPIQPSLYQKKQL